MSTFQGLEETISSNGLFCSLYVDRGCREHAVCPPMEHAFCPLKMPRKDNCSGRYVFRICRTWHEFDRFRIFNRSSRFGIDTEARARSGSPVRRPKLLPAQSSFPTSPRRLESAPGKDETVRVLRDGGRTPNAAPTGDSGNGGLNTLLNATER